MQDEKKYEQRWLDELDDDDILEAPRANRLTDTPISHETEIPDCEPPESPDNNSE